VAGGSLVAGLHLDVQTQAQGGDPVGVVGVAGAAGFVRIVADARAFLPAVDRLDGDVDIEDPFCIQERMTCLVEVAAQPVLPRRCVDARQGAAPAILADDGA